MSAVGWMVHATMVSLLVTPAAWLLEHGLTRLRLATRWVWVGALAASVLLPVGALVTMESVPTEQAAEPTRTELVDLAPLITSEAPARSQGLVDAVLDRVRAWRASLDRGVASVAERVAEGSAPFGRWIALGWAATSLLVAALLLSTTLKLLHRVRLWPRQAHLGRDVRVAPRLGPATVGLLRPEIVLPRWAVALPSQRLELILTHEEEHARSRDPLLLALGLLALVATPWNPLVWWQHRRLRDAVEVDCDRRVLARGAPPPRYGDLLLWMGSRGRPALLPVPTMTASKSLLERRLTAMKKTSSRAALPRTFGATILAAGLLVVACTTEPPLTGEGSGAAASEAVVERNPLVADVWVEPDGRVFINDVPCAMEDVSEALLALDAASPAGDLVVSLQADPAAPYGVMHDLQQELRASGMVRVVFATRTEPRRTPPGEPSDVLEGLALVLPDAGMQEPVSGRNLLHLVVRPSGVVEVRRGTAPEVRRLSAADVEALWRREVASNPRLIAAVKVHRDASYTHMTEVLDALHAAEAQRISIQALGEPEASRPDGVAPDDSDLERLSDLTAELSTLRDRYSDDYPRIQAVLAEMRAVERGVRR